MQPYAAEWLSIIPPIVAIGLALMTKEVFSSLLVGIFTGTLIYAVGTGGNIVMGTTEVAFKMMAQKLDFNIIIFCSLLGALVYVITMAGGTKAYGKAAELVCDFHNAVDDYLTLCEETHKEPERAYKGSFNVRISPELHKQAVIFAAAHNMSLNSFVENSIQQAVHTR